MFTSNRNQFSILFPMPLPVPLLFHFPSPTKKDTSCKQKNNEPGTISEQNNHLDSTRLEDSLLQPEKISFKPNPKP